jgi:hypothetical protein
MLYAVISTLKSNRMLKLLKRLSRDTAPERIIIPGKSGSSAWRRDGRSAYHAPTTSSNDELVGSDE